MKHIQSLTSLRIFFALGVVFHHTGSQIGALHPFLQTVFQNGYVGVSFFFVLSGFLLALTSAQKTGFDQKRFWWARVARIVPVYLLSFLLTWASTVIWETHPLNHWYNVLHYLTFTVGWKREWVFEDWNSGTWSLTCEMLFYVLFPWIYKALNHLKTPWLYGVATVLYLVLLTGAALYVVWDWGQFNPPLHLCQMTMGAIAGLVFARKDHLWMLKVQPLVVAGLGLALLGVTWQGALMVNLLNYGVLSPLIALGLVGVAVKPPRILNHPALVFLGGASYAVYLLEHPIQVFHREALGLSYSIPMTPLQVLWHMVVVVALSSGVYHIFEGRAKKAILQWSNPKQKPASDA